MLIYQPQIQSQISDRYTQFIKDYHNISVTESPSAVTSNQPNINAYTGHKTYQAKKLYKTSVIRQRQITGKTSTL